jgi:hypothetical protein
MEWYHLFNPLTEKIIALAILAIAFALILYRKINITYISLVGAALLSLPASSRRMPPSGTVWNGRS